MEENSKLNISAGDNCSGGWRKETHNSTSFCRLDSENVQSCTSAYFSTNGINYQKVCGRVRRYQKAVIGFYPSNRQGQTIDGAYADCLLIAYSTPWQHTWTYTSGPLDDVTAPNNCTCAFGGGHSPPGYVGGELLLHIRNI